MGDEDIVTVIYRVINPYPNRLDQPALETARAILRQLRAAGVLPQAQKPLTWLYKAGGEYVADTGNGELAVRKSAVMGDSFAWWSVDNFGHPNGFEPTLEEAQTAAESHHFLKRSSRKEAPQCPS